MQNRYIVFDVETPNSRNDRMSAIGIAVAEGGQVVQKFSTLVNPETHFDAFNIQLTGITPEMAASAPTFPQLWERIAPLMSSGILAAHNAPFDMGVLFKCLRHYGISWRAEAEYVCTCRMGKALFPELPNHKLNTVCGCLDIPLSHHDAGSDAAAAAELLCRCMARGGSPAAFLRSYDLCCGGTRR